jgi:hypothetical protein
VAETAACVGMRVRSSWLAPEPQDVEHGRVDVGERAVDAGLQHGVVEAGAAQGAVAELGGQRGVARLKLAVAEQTRQHEVGVGVALADGGEQVERDLPRGVGRRGAVAGGGPTPLAGGRRHVQRSRAPGAARAASRRPASGPCPPGAPRRAAPPSSRCPPAVGGHLACASSPASGVTGPSLTRLPRSVVHAPGCRRAGAHSGRRARRRRPVDAGVVGVILERRLTPSAAAAPRARPRPPARQRRHQQLGAGRGQRSSRSPLVSVGPHPLGHDAEHRPGVQALLEAEGAGAGDLVAVQQRVLHGGRAAPGREQREVQVDPAVPRQVEQRRRHERAVGDDGHAVRAISASRLLERLLARVPRRQHLQPGLQRALLDRARAQGAAASGGASGAGDDGDDVVPAGEQRLERRQRGRRRARRRRASRGDQRASRTAGAGWP